MITKLSKILCLLLPVTILLGNAASDCTATIIGIFGLYHIIKINPQLLKQQWFITAVLFYIYIVIQSFISHDIVKSLKLTIPFIRYILFALALQFYIGRFNISKQILVILAAVVGFMIMDGIIQYFMHSDLFGKKLVIEQHEYGQVTRLSGPYNTLRLGATLTFIAMPLLAYFLQKIDTSRNKLFALTYMLLVAIYLVTIFLSGERMAFITSMLCISILVIYFYHKQLKLLAALALLLIISLSSFIIFYPDLIARHLHSVITAVTNFSHNSYGQLWLTAWLMGKENILFGQGAKQFSNLCPNHMQFNPEQWCNLHPHNFYLEIFSEFGLIGLLLWSAMFIFIIRTLWHKRYLTKLHPEFVGLYTIIAIRLLPFIATSSFFKNWSAVPFWFMIGWGLGISEISKNQLHKDITN